MSTAAKCKATAENIRPAAPTAIPHINAHVLADPAACIEVCLRRYSSRMTSQMTASHPEGVLAVGGRVSEPAKMQINYKKICIMHGWYTLYEIYVPAETSESHPNVSPRPPYL